MVPGAFFAFGIVGEGGARIHGAVEHAQHERIVRARVYLLVKVGIGVDLFFREQGRGWQTRMNAVLRAYANAKRSAKTS
ncbi:MAG: hypothetical protein EOO07_29045 [Chitinophagaceae bacterium]|nr:MAG: hypothetical protein EOO07_29045 [Chitinophagaceae bacterium]